jgi:hypothetical protein
VIDGEGTVTPLSKALRENIIRVNAFMSPIPLASLPTVGEVFDARKKGIAPAKQELVVKIEAVPPEPKDVYIQAIELATQKRFQEDSEKLAQFQQHQLRQKEVEIDRSIAAKMDEIKKNHAEQVQAFRDARAKERSGLQGVLDAIQSRLNPTLAAEKAQERAREYRDFLRTLAKERADQLTLQQQNKQMEIEAALERQGREAQNLKSRTEQDLARYIREHQEAMKLRDELSRKQLDRNESLREGPPPPKLGKS